MTSLVEQKRQEREANDRLVLRCLVTGPATPALLAQATGIAERTLRDRLKSLIENGLVRRQGGQRSPLEITPAGRAFLSPATPREVPPTPEGGLDGLLTLLPGDVWRSMARLVLAGITARHHLRHDFPPGVVWPCFGAIGEQNTGKSMLIWAIAQHLGLDHTPIHAPRLSGGELVGQRGSRPGEFAESSYLSRTLLALEELDKTKPASEAAEAIRELLQGNAVMQIAGKTVRCAATLYVSANWRPEDLTAPLWEPYAGRAIILHTTGLPGADDLDEVAASIPAAPVRPLDSYRPARGLDLAALVRRVKALLYPLLTPQGRKMIRVQGVALIAAGMTAQLDDPTDVDAAVAQTVVHYLTVTATIPGRVVPAWPQLLAAKVGEAADLVDHLAAIVDEQRDQVDHAERKALAGDLVDDQFVKQRAMLAHDVGEVLRYLDARRLKSLPRPLRSEAAGVRAQMTSLASVALAARTPQELGRVNARAAAVAEGLSPDLRGALAAIEKQMQAAAEKDTSAPAVALGEPRPQRELPAAAPEKSTTVARLIEAGFELLRPLPTGATPNPKRPTIAPGACPIRCWGPVPQCPGDVRHRITWPDLDGPDAAGVGVCTGHLDAIKSEAGPSVGWPAAELLGAAR